MSAAQQQDDAKRELSVLPKNALSFEQVRLPALARESVPVLNDAVDEKAQSLPRSLKDVEYNAALLKIFAQGLGRLVRDLHSKTERQRILESPELRDFQTEISSKAFQDLCLQLGFYLNRCGLFPMGRPCRASRSFISNGGIDSPKPQELGAMEFRITHLCLTMARDDLKLSEENSFEEERFLHILSKTLEAGTEEGTERLRSSLGRQLRLQSLATRIPGRPSGLPQEN